MILGKAAQEGDKKTFTSQRQHYNEKEKTLLDLQVKETKAYLVKHIKYRHPYPCCCCSGNATLYSRH